MFKFLVTAAMITCASPCLAGQAAYSLSTFTQDCRQSGGVPRLYGQSVICEDRAHADIVCLRNGDQVHSCTLSQSSARKAQSPSG